MDARRAFGGGAAAACFAQGAPEPAAARYTSMSVARTPAATLPNAPRVFTPRESLPALDARGARPRSLPPARARAPPELAAPVEGSHPLPLPTARARPGDHREWHELDDLAGAHPRAVAFGARGRRQLDPLAPTYALPRAPVPPPPEPAFKRDLHSVADIDGAAPRRRRTYEERRPGPLVEVG